MSQKTDVTNVIRVPLMVGEPLLDGVTDIARIIKDARWAPPRTDRENLRRYYRGRTEDLAPEMLAGYTWMPTEKRNILFQYFAYVNLLKPAVNRLVSGVYGGTVTRQVSEGSPYRDQVMAAIGDQSGYSQACRGWFKSAVHYGDGVLAFTIVNDLVEVWRPNPITTWIVTDPNDVTRLAAIVEPLPDGRLRYVTRTEWGIITKGGQKTDVAQHGLGIVPAVVCYGESQQEYGEVYGDSMVQSGLVYSRVVSQLMLNQIALMMNYVSPQAVATGEVKNEDPEAAFKGGLLEMNEGGSFQFVTPQTNFKDLVATIDSYKSNFCISEGIPMDALDPSVIPENQSATSARLRNQPLSVTINRLIQEQKANEVKALTIIGALYQFIDTRKTVDFPDFQRRFDATVMMEPSGKPESYAEEVSAWQQLQAMGAKELEDVIRHFNENLPESEVRRRAEAFRAGVSADVNSGPVTDGGMPGAPDERQREADAEN